MPDKGKKLTIGLMLNSLDYEYQISIWTGIQNAAKEAGVNTICFTGTELNSPDIIMNAKNTVYEVISKKNVDGLIVIPSSIFLFMNNEECGDYFERYRHIPSVSIGSRIRNIPSIIVDNRSGMKEIVDHLIEVHGCRNLLYIGGPSNNPEAAERLYAFKRSMEDHGIPANPDNIKVSDFSLESAYELVLELAKTGFDFGAIVAANDNMAMGAVKALQERNMFIPDDVLVTGFDGIDSVKFSSFPLTTAHQPMKEMTKRAIQILIKSIDGGKTNDIETMKTEFIARRSCGCFPPEIDGYFAERTGAFSDLNGALNDLKNKMKDSFGAEHVPLFDEMTGHFIEAVNDEVTEKDFLRFFYNTACHSIENDYNDSLWDNFLSRLRLTVMPYLHDNSAKIMKAGSLFHNAGMLVKESAKQVESNRKSMIVERTRSFQQIMSDLVNSFDMDMLFEKMADGFPKIKIKRCFLSVISAEEPGKMRLIFAFDENGRISLDKNGYEFPSEELFPGELVKAEDRKDMIVETFEIEKEKKGLIVLGLNPHEGILISSLIDQIRSTVKAAMLMEEILEKGAKLEKTKLELKDNHEKLLTAEKMASLGRLTAGIVHEMNSHLAASRASLNELKNLIDEYELSVKDADITPEDHFEIAGEMKSAAGLADKAIEQATKFIKSIKTQTRKINQEEKLDFNMIDIIDDNLLLLGHLLKYKGLSVEFTHPEKPVMLFGNPGRMSQVLTNLITNSSDAMENKKGVITVGLTENEGKMELRIKDEGCGIPDNIIPKIFNPLFTTKPPGLGTGLGLTIVHDIIYDEFGGTIAVESKADSGTTFILKFNKNK
jgi:DNA-binding LacI/PurR family transcriptional regulator/signal transduction histidine kinase